MPGDPRECRAHAKRCLEMAEDSTNPALQESLTDIAHHWMRLARELEAAQRLVKRLRYGDTTSNGQFSGVN